MNKIVLISLLTLLSNISLQAQALEVADPFKNDPSKNLNETNKLDLVPRYKINEIVVEGAQNRQEVIKLVFMIKEGQFVTEEKIRQELQNVYNLGYFKNDIDFRPERSGDGFRIVIKANENPKLKSIQIKGNTLIKENDIRKEFSSQMGKTINFNEFKSSLEKIRDVYVKDGYQGVLIVPDIQDSGDVSLRITEGVIEEIKIEGNKETKEYVIRRDIRQKPGEIYNAVTFEEDRRRLTNTTFFDSVNIKYEPGKKDPDNIIVIISVKEPDFSGNFSPGIGYSVRDGITGQVSLSKNNLFGTGQSVGLDLRAGGGWFAATSGFNFIGRLDWNDPWFLPDILPPKTGFGASIYKQRENNLFQNVGLFSSQIGNIVSNYSYPLNNDRTGAAINVSKSVFGDPITSPFTLSLSVKAESISPIIPSVQNVSIKDGNIEKTYSDLEKNNKNEANQLKQQFDSYVDTQIRKGLTLSQRGYDNRVALGLNLTYNTLDYVADPHDGWFNSILVEPSVGDLTYLKIYGNATKFIPIPIPISDKFTFALNAQVGVLTGGKISVYERFYSSANQAIRGWPENGYLNGERLFLGSAELRFPIYNILSGVLFIDAGNFWDQDWKVTDSNINDRKTNGKLDNQNLLNQYLRLGYGLGLRLNTPLGLIRFDYGIRDLSKPFDLSNGAQLHFNMGQKF